MNQGIEARRFFRIKDTIDLDFHVLNDEEYQQRKAQSDEAAVPEVDALTRLNQEIQQVLERLRVKGPDVAKLGELLDSKIQHLIDRTGLANDLQELDNYLIKKNVDLSACGISFHHEKSIPIDSYIAIELMLKPNRQYLQIVAVVVDCERNEDIEDEEESEQKYKLRLEFVDMNERVQEFLIQYLVKRQGRLIKNNKETSQKTLPH